MHSSQLLDIVQRPWSIVLQIVHETPQMKGPIPNPNTHIRKYRRRVTSTLPSSLLTSLDASHVALAHVVPSLESPSHLFRRCRNTQFRRQSLWWLCHVWLRCQRRRWATAHMRAEPARGTGCQKEKGGSVIRLFNQPLRFGYHTIW